MPGLHARHPWRPEDSVKAAAGDMEVDWRAEHYRSPMPESGDWRQGARSRCGARGGDVHAVVSASVVGTLRLAAVLRREGIPCPGVSRHAPADEGRRVRVTGNGGSIDAVLMSAV